MIYRKVYPFVLIKFDRRVSGRKMEFKEKKKSTVASFYTSHLWMLDLTGKVYTNDSGKWAQLAQTREHY